MNFLQQRVLSRLALGIVMAVLACGSARGEEVKAEPTLEQRVADLEAYVNNGGRGPATSKVPGPGPGHNAWMMTSSALVLFMTLPGLALFYGGLVRSKNVLSVLAQCLGIAGLVTVLWWAVGYSFVFASGSPILGSAKFAFLRGVGSNPNTTMPIGFRTTRSPCIR
jgi:Amt family ammonium transporter